MGMNITLNGIYIDMDSIISKYNGKIQSITDIFEIQQIYLFCQQNYSDYRKATLLDMINPQFAFAALYSHINNMYNIIPDKVVYNESDMRRIFDSSHKFSSFESYMLSLSCERNKFKDL